MAGRFSKGFSRAICILTSLLFSSSSWAGILPDEVPVVVGPDEVGAVKESLKAQWNRLRSEVHSATIQYGSFRAPIQEPWVETERMLPLLEEHGVLQQPERIVEVIQLLNRRSKPFARLFIPAEIHMQGRQIRTEYGETTHALDENHHYYFQRDNRAIYLYRRGQDHFAYDHPVTLRPIPDVRILPAAEQILRYPQAGVLQINQPPRANGARSFHVVHEATGLPYFQRVLTRSGERVRDYLFLDYVTFPGDVIFPSWTLEFRYRNGNVSYVCAIRLDEAEFNAPLKPSDLTFSADAGVYIRDERNANSPISVRFHQDVPDVAFYVDHVLDFSNPPPTTLAREDQSFPVRSIVLWANGILLTVFGLYLWRWRRPQRTSADD